MYWPTNAQNVSVRLLTAVAVVQYQAVNVWIVVDKIALGLVILLVLRLPLTVIIPSVRGWYNAVLVDAVARDWAPFPLPHPKHKETLDVYNFKQGLYKFRKYNTNYQQAL